MNQTGYRTNTVKEAIRHQNQTHERTDIGGFGSAVSGTETAKATKKANGAESIRMKSMRKPPSGDPTARTGPRAASDRRMGHPTCTTGGRAERPR